MCLQETKVTDSLFPAGEFEEAGYRSAILGQKTYNGVAVLHRMEIEDISAGLPSGFLGEQKRILSFSACGIRFLNVYVPNGGDVESPRFADKLRWLDELREMALSMNGPVIILGDFNVAPGPDDTHSPREQDGTVCYHPLERQRIGEFIESGFSDVFRAFNPQGKAYSWWDYRAASFRRNRGMRLDLILANRTALGLICDCSIHTETRSWERPSDHVPVSLRMRIT